MKALSTYRLGRSLLAAVLLAAACDAGASTLGTDEAAASTAGLGALSLQETLASPGLGGALLPRDALLPLPSSYYGGNNPYVLFADTLALSPSVPQTRGSSAVYLYDANNGLAAPGPVPLPAPLLLLAAGLCTLAAARRGRPEPTTA